MTSQPFRFLHASDIRLDEPVTGLAEVPDHLLETILDAPRLAAERMFQTAMTEKVDFVLLTGDTLSTDRTGPWGAVFLLEQFEKLRREGIAVYWAGGKAQETDEWPALLPLPENVHLFRSGEVAEYVHCRGGLPIAWLVGMGAGTATGPVRPDAFVPDTDGLFSIGVLYGRPSNETLRACGLQYWGLGGGFKPETEMLAGTPVHHPGPVLARTPFDGILAGATIVEVDETQRTELKRVKTSPVGWTSERLTLPEDPDEEAFSQAMRNRLANLRKTQTEEVTFVAWQFDVPPIVATELRYGNLSMSLLRGVRSEFGREKPALWSYRLDPVLPDVEEDEQARQTILGDYLRMVQYYKENPEEKLGLSDYFSDELKEYLAIHQAMEKQHQKQSAENPKPEMSALDTAVRSADTFRPEVLELIRLLSLDPDERRLFRPVPEGDRQEVRYRRFLNQLAAERAAALKEASMLGLELLSEESEELPAIKRPVQKRSPLLAEEHKAVEIEEGKEARR